MQVLKKKTALQTISGQQPQTKLQGEPSYTHALADLVI